MSEVRMTRGAAFLERVRCFRPDAVQAALDLHAETGEAYFVEYDPWKATYPWRVYRAIDGPMPQRGEVLSYHAVTGRAVVVSFTVGSPRVVRLPRITRTPVPARVVAEVLAA